VEAIDLLTAPADTSLIVTRVTDQDPEFLRFVEQYDLVPGREVRVVSRDTAADTVQLELAAGGRQTIGVRAASKILVREDQG
jgi:hypothetical protein